MNEFTVKFYTEQNKVDPLFLEQLEEFAEKFGLQLSYRSKLSINQMREFLDMTPLNREEFIKETETFSKEIGPIKSDCAQDIREIRDSR